MKFIVLNALELYYALYFWYMTNFGRWHIGSKIHKIYHKVYLFAYYMSDSCPPTCLVVVYVVGIVLWKFNIRLEKGPTVH